MFEWILFGLVAAVTVAACITIDTLRKAMDKANINFAEIIDIDRVHNKVTLKDLESRAKMTVTGEDISKEIRRGRKIRRQPVATAPKNEERESFISGSLFTPEEERMFEWMENDPAMKAELAAQLADNERRLKEAQERGSLFTLEEARMFEWMENDPAMKAELAAQARSLEEAEKNGKPLLFIGDNY